MKSLPVRLAVCILLTGGIVAAAIPRQLHPAGRDSLTVSRSYNSSFGVVALRLPADYPVEAGAYLQEVTEDVALALISRFGLVEAAPFQLVIVNSREQLEKWVGAELPKWIHAVAQEHPPRVVLLGSAASVTDPANHRLEKTLLHELIHVYLYRLAPSLNGGPLPGWLHEGLAVHISGGLDRGMHRALIRGRLTNRFYTLEQLSRIYHTSSVLSELAYAQSVIATQSMEAFYGEVVFRSLFDEIRRGRSFLTAFALAAGETLDQFQTRYQMELKRRYNLLIVMADPSVLFILLPLLVLAAYFIRVLRNRAITARWAAEGFGGDDDPGGRTALTDEGDRAVD